MRKSEFINKMLILGARLELAASFDEGLDYLKDAEKLYDKHLASLMKVKKKDKQKLKQ
mgnify:CR=1 FL=1